jgi:hypothetical protein
MKYDRDTIGQDLLVGLADAQLWEGHVSMNGHQFVQSFRALLPQPVKNLQNNKIGVSLPLHVAVIQGTANLGFSWTGSSCVPVVGL